jgi:hypothetical protein
MRSATNLLYLALLQIIHFKVKFLNESNKESNNFTFLIVNNIFILKK